jgi:hypothetical protein
MTSIYTKQYTNPGEQLRINLKAQSTNGPELRFCALSPAAGGRCASSGLENCLRLIDTIPRYRVL